MNRSTRVGWAAAGLFLVIVIAGLVVDRVWRPALPDDPSLPLVAVAALEGDAGSNAAAGECLDRIERPAGGLDLCWGAYRESREIDPTQDYYQLRVFGSFGFDTGSGIRWVAVRVEPEEAASAEILDAWPSGVFEGECEQVQVALGLGPGTPEMLCGRTTATTPAGSDIHRVDWTCTSCLVPDQMTRAIALYEFVAVPAGTVPSCRLPDLGG
ncbi:MAG TPA: hypothetical protein VFO73_00535 [Candidatus Limnocylindrales bacterium]|nr:hypothetical protein [Candidatus Limnocylindrales bacterium]